MNINQIGASAAYTYVCWGLNSTVERILESIERLGRLEYKMCSLEILEPPLAAMYEGGNSQTLLKKRRETGLKFSSFIPYHCVTNLSSAQQERRELGVKQFAQGVEAAKRLEIPLVTIASDWPPEWVSGYSAAYDHAPALEFALPSRQEYERVWCAHLDALASCLEIAEKNQLRMGYEPRANCLVSNIDTFIWVSDKLASKDFFCVLDVTHCAYHRENLPVAIKKLGSRLGILQACGTDGASFSHLPLADDLATMNLVKALHEIDFKGILDVELIGLPSAEIDPSYRRGREILERHIAAVNS